MVSSNVKKVILVRRKDGQFLSGFVMKDDNPTPVWHNEDVLTFDVADEAMIWLIVYGINFTQHDPTYCEVLDADTLK